MILAAGHGTDGFETKGAPHEVGGKSNAEFMGHFYSEAAGADDIAAIVGWRKADIVKVAFSQESNGDRVKNEQLGTDMPFFRHAVLKILMEMCFCFSYRRPGP